MNFGDGHGSPVTGTGHHVEEFKLNRSFSLAGSEAKGGQGKLAGQVGDPSYPAGYERYPT